MKMRKFVLLAVFAFTASTAAASGLHETVDVQAAKGKWKGFEWKKTREFMKEMETRPDFPVSTVLAYDYVYSLTALGDKVSPPQKERILKYLKEVQQKEGGFGGDQANRTSSTLFTDLGVETLGLLKSAGGDGMEKAGRFVLAQKHADGGFGFSAASREPTLATSYYGVKVLASANILGSLDKGKTAAFVRGFEKKSGGFGFARGNGGATARATYMALYTLDAIGMLDDPTKKGAGRFLESTPCGTKGSGRPDLDEVAYAVRAEKLLKTKGAIDAKKVKAFLKALYIPVNGGFAPLEGYGATPDSTTTALHVLADLK